MTIEAPPLAKDQAPRTRGERVIRFIEAFCRVPEGSKVGQPLVLDDFQKRFILEVYDNPHGTNTAILSMARKNGKTAIIAALVLVHVAGPEALQNSVVLSGARSRKQAALVFRLAAKMVGLNPKLSALVQVKDSQKKLVGLSKNVEYEAIAAEATTQIGDSPVVAILDELGQVKGPQDDFVDAITTSQGAYDNPLLFVISTQAPTDGDMLSIWIDDARDSGDPHTVCHVYAAPADADLMDREAWAAANPAMGKFRSEADVRRQAEKAVRMPTAENTFRNLYLNQRVQRQSPFVSPSVWKQNGGEVVIPERAEVFAALDLSQTLDFTSLTVVHRDPEGLVHWLSYFWTPADTLADRAKQDRAPYETWVRSGHVRAVPGKAVDYDVVARDMDEILRPFALVNVAFDRWRMPTFEKACEHVGVTFPLVEFGQGFQSMSPAIDAVERLLIEGRVRHGMHPALTSCASNAVVVKDPAGNRKLDKAKSTGRIDGVVSAVMATGLMDSTLKKDEDLSSFLANPVSA